ncbi:ABC transporter substrate-binding protein [Sulfurimonas sp.]|uniref:ABC transporter substrate-binding protein n=1 Tax=Sulfurimonas sp. TaxID=2022749 RepID=UPI003D0FBBFC
MRILFLVFFFIESLFATTQSSYAKDFLGKEFIQKDTLQRIAITCYGGALQEISLFLDPKTIVAHPGTQRFSFFAQIFPKLESIPTIGTFNEINFETLLKLKPDIVFAGVTSLPTNKRIEEFGIEVFTLGIGKHNIDSLLQEFRNVGILTNQQTKASKLINYWQLQLNYIQTHIPAKPFQKKVFYVNGTNKLSSEGKYMWGNDFLTKAGGINIVENFEGKTDISVEKLIAFNPDIIILSNNKSAFLSPQELAQNNIYKNVKAVQNQQVYVSPVGGFWWDRPSPEAILGIMWLSKVLYPKEMKGLDLSKETKYFFKTFYNYSLTNHEYKNFFYHKEIQ